MESYMKQGKPFHLEQLPLYQNLLLVQELVGDHAEVIATVLGPGSLVMTLNGGVFLAVGNHLELAGGNAQGHHVVIGSTCTAFAKSKVVFLGAAFVAVAFDAHADGVVALHQLSLGLQDFLILGLNGVLIKCKQHATIGDLLNGSLHFRGNASVSIARFCRLLGATKTGSKSHHQRKNESETFHYKPPEQLLEMEISILSR